MSETPEKPRSRLSNPKYLEKKEPSGKPRKGCVGCGGEKFDPPKTPAEMEQILIEHINLGS